MAPLAGNTGLNSSGPGPGQYMDQGVLDAHGIIGGPDPDHGKPGVTGTPEWPAAYGSGYKGTSYGPDVENQGQTGATFYSPGYPYDTTPNVHSSPYPAGIQQTTSDPGSYAVTADLLANQRHALHGRDMGAPAKYNRNSPAGREVPTNYTTDRYDAPNQNNLATDVPGQIRGSGSALQDSTQGFGRLNSLDEFQRGHSIRRIQHDRMPWNRSLDYAPAKPFMGRLVQTKGTMFNTDSPYGQVAGDTSTGQQVVREAGYPTAYAPPSEPYIAPSGPSNDVWAW